MIFPNSTLLQHVLNENINDIQNMINNNEIHPIVAIFYGIENNKNNVINAFIDFSFSEYELNGILSVASVYGNFTLIQKLGTKFNPVYYIGLKYGAYNPVVVDYYLNNNLCNLNNSISFIVKYNMVDQINYFISKGFTNYNFGLYVAKKYNHQNLIDLFINLGGVDEDFEDLEYADIYKYDNGLIYGCQINSPSLAKYFLDKGGQTYIEAFVECVRNANLDMINYFISLGVNNFNLGLIHATSINNTNLIQYFMSLGANNYNDCLIVAVISNNINLINYFINLGATNKTEAISYTSNQEIINLLSN
jgi:hypothetical protein